MKTVMVTGVSTGIGLATASALIEAGFHVFGSVRTEADAQSLREKFPDHFTPVVFDVTDIAAIENGARQVAAAIGNETLDGLINNAGIAISGPLLYLPLDLMRKQFEVNLFGLLAVTQAFAPLLGVDRNRQGKPGRIINISSVAGKIGSPFVGAYVASKHALEGLSETLRRELMLFGIDVILVGPGAIRTPIWGKADLSSYSNTPYKASLEIAYAYMQQLARGGLAPERCADLLVKILTISQPSTRYALVPKPIFNWLLPRFLPKRWIDAEIARRLGLKQSWKRVR